MKLDDYDKENIGGKVAKPFFDLAKKIDGRTTNQLALRVFKEEVVPPLLKVKEAFPEFWGRLTEAKGFYFETHTEPVTRRSRYYASHYSRDKAGVLEISDLLKRHRIPVLVGITSETVYGSCKSPEVTQERMQAIATPEERLTIQKSHDLREKGARVQELLGDFLKTFTMPEQVPYSLPQLNYFMQKMDFRKRNRWNDRPPMPSQKRPRVVVAPSAELRQLVMESMLLHQAIPAEED